MRFFTLYATAAVIVVMVFLPTVTEADVTVIPVQAVVITPPVLVPVPVVPEPVVTGDVEFVSPAFPLLYHFRTSVVVVPKRVVRSPVLFPRYRGPRLFLIR